MKAALSKEFYKSIIDSFNDSGTTIDEEVIEVVQNAVSEEISSVVLASVDFMKEDGRKKLFIADCIAALKKLRIEPIFGHQFEEGYGFHFVDTSNCFFPDDASIIDLMPIIYPD